MASIGKTELTRRIAKKTGQTQKATSVILEATTRVIQEALTEHEEVRLVGFGAFKVDHCAARHTINPRTRESMIIPEKDRVRFSPGKDLSGAVAGD